MKVYWSPSRIPELAGKEKHEVNEIWRAASLRSLRDLKTWLLVLPAVACGMIGGEFGRVGGTIGAVIGAVVAAHWSMHLTRPHIVAIIAERQKRAAIDEGG
ncbi:MAG: hypothetical protein IH945_02360 [Armatimonadetes bacterium]|nr:hypothetical protein [Armatimonadota bacterium]